MKRVGGQVTWLCEFDVTRAELVKVGRKRTTLRRCKIVAAGDTLRLAAAGEDPFGEVTVGRVWDLCITVIPCGGSRCVFAAALNGNLISDERIERFAVADGFAGAEEMVLWLINRGKVVNGTFDGQIIEW